MKPRRIPRAEYVARLQKARNAYEVLVGKPVERSILFRGKTLEKCVVRLKGGCNFLGILFNGGLWH